MPLFVVIPTEDDTTIGVSLAEKYGNKALELPRGEWLVSYDGTSKQFSDELGISENLGQSAVVLNFSGYWGYADNSIWEWLAVNAK